MQVHRHRVAKVHEAREPERRPIQCGVGGGEGGELGVGGAQDHHVGGGLGKVDGLRAVVDGARLGS